MQTFLPYASFERSASVLDQKRLGKQRVETLQIMKALNDPDYGWQSHPAVKMWRGRRGALLMYQEAICNEWTGRGYKDTCLDKTRSIAVDFSPSEWFAPFWLGHFDLHASHRSNLLRKLPAHYGPLFEPGLSDDLEYVWPVS